MKIFWFVLLLSAHCELTTALTRQHFYFSNGTTWTKAQSFCRAYYNDLSSVDSQEEITAINTASGLSGSYTDSWIGLRLMSTNNWQWSDGSNRSFVFWAAGQPNYSGNENCTTVKNGQLNNKQCTESHGYFCYKWDTKLIVVKENKNWGDALKYCRTHHTDLASLPTDLHFIQAKQTIANTSTIWTGLRFLAGSWFWLSGESLGYVSAQLPVRPTKNIFCGSLNLKTQRWENRNCMEKRNFVCY